MAARGGNCDFAMSSLVSLAFFFFFNDTATTEIYTLSLHDALPICRWFSPVPGTPPARTMRPNTTRSEEHTSELQSLRHLVCRLLLEKKKTTKYSHHATRSPMSCAARHDLTPLR